MTALASLQAAILALGEVAKVLQTEQGQRLLKELLDGGDKVTGAIAKVEHAVAALFHHTKYAAPAPAPTTPAPANGGH